MGVSSTKPSRCPVPPPTASPGIAAEHGVYLAVGINERDANGGTIYNSLIYFGPDGELLGCHRKLMPTGGERLAWGSWRRFDPDRVRHAVRSGRWTDLLGELHAHGPHGDVRARHRHPARTHMGQLRYLGSYPAPHRQGRPLLRHRLHAAANTAATYPPISPDVMICTRAARTTG